MEMRRIKVRETIDRRFLGALRFVDRVTGAMVRRPMNIIGPGLKFITNRSHLQVISYAKGLEDHLDAFVKPPDEPDKGSLRFNIIIQDPSGEYLEQSMTLNLPRDPDPGENNSIFEPVEVSLFSCPAARLRPNWSIIRASVFDLADMEKETPVPGALLRVLDGDDNLIMSGMSDQRGEAIVIIPGIPISSFAQGEEPPPDGPDHGDDHEDRLASGPVVETSTLVRLEMVVDIDSSWPADPGKMEQNKEVWQRNFRDDNNDDDDDELMERMELALKTGKSQSVKLFVNLTDE